MHYHVRHSQHRRGLHGLKQLPVVQHDRAVPRVDQHVQYDHSSAQHRRHMHGHHGANMPEQLSVPVVLPRQVPHDGSSMPCKLRDCRLRRAVHGLQQLPVVHPDWAVPRVDQLLFNLSSTINMHRHHGVFVPV